MLDSKQRAFLRGMANTMPSLFQIGKDGITPSVIEQLDTAITAREIIKVTVLETADVSAKDALAALAEALCAEPVQAIGRKITLYRMNRDNPKIQLPKPSKKQIKR